ncbi:tetratricopeptide repeat protein [Streptomyces sp. CB02923]|uniref:tetratricopeptide repeat protein n=1 Tax=Streptomyces sp. CB02923 TaxID=1718985 RepID=UPI000A9800A4|nr:tetratricopeptide repeat protein [Streptomyces sp. CB02923]
MASPAARSASSHVPAQPNRAFRQLRGRLSPGEFAAAVRRAAREIGEQVACDARYVGRVEAGEIRCPNYAYERVFRHMFPGLTLADMGFAARETVRGRRSRTAQGGDGTGTGHDAGALPGTWTGAGQTAGAPAGPGPGPCHRDTDIQTGKESDVLRRAFITGGPAAALGLTALPPFVPEAAAGPRVPGAVPRVPGAVPRAPGTVPRVPGPSPAVGPGRAGESEAAAVEEAVRRIRLLDDRHGGEGLYRRAAKPLRTAYELLDAGVHRRSVSDRLHAGAGELAISVGWLAHDSGRFGDARSHYAEALATARVAGDAALEAHAFCNTAFLARDANRPREAVRAAQAAQQAAKSLGSPRLLSLLALREAGGWAGLGDRRSCERALLRAQRLFARGPSDGDPEWMSFYGEAELAGLEAQCWSALGEQGRAATYARRAVALQDPHFTRNIALFTAELASDLALGRAPEEAATAGTRALALLEDVRSARIRTMLDSTARALRPYRDGAGRRGDAVGAFLDRHAATRPPVRTSVGRDGRRTVSGARPRPGPGSRSEPGPGSGPGSEPGSGPQADAHTA